MYEWYPVWSIEHGEEEQILGAGTHIDLYEYRALNTGYEIATGAPIFIAYEHRYIRVEHPSLWAIVIETVQMSIYMLVHGLIKRRTYKCIMGRMHEGNGDLR